MSTSVHLSPIKLKVFELLSHEENRGRRFQRAKGAIKQLAFENQWKETSVAQALVDLAKMGLVQKERKGREVEYFFEDRPASLPQTSAGTISGKRTIVYFKDTDGQIMATVPSLPGCSTKGSTLEEASRKIRDMARGYLTYSRYNGGAIPLELAMESVALTEHETV